MRLQSKCAWMFLLFNTVALSDDATLIEPLTDEQRTKLTHSLEVSLNAAQKLIDTDAENVNALSQRGDALFFLGRFDEAVADYDQMVKLDPKLDDSHWRRGIALFYAGRYKGAASQFERYHSFDQVDRENGIWRYLSQHRAHGRDKAREGLLKYEKDDREPFPSVYKLFAGSIEPDDILKRIALAEIPDKDRESRLFYAHLYIGLNAAVENRDAEAQQHLWLGTRNTWGPAAGYGPRYMWHVGRLHEEQLRNKIAKSK